MALPGFCGSHSVWTSPWVANSPFWDHPIFPDHRSRPTQFSRTRGNSFLFTYVESYPLTKRLLCAFLCPIPLWILFQQRQMHKRSPQKTIPKKPQANQTHTDTQKTQSTTMQFPPHGFIPVHCRAERFQNPLGISKVARFFLRVSKSKFSKPYSAAQTLG